MGGWGPVLPPLSRGDRVSVSVLPRPRLPQPFPLPAELPIHVPACGPSSQDEAPAVPASSGFFRGAPEPLVGVSVPALFPMSGG